MARPVPALDLPQWVLDALIAGDGAPAPTPDPLEFVTWHD